MNLNFDLDKLLETYSDLVVDEYKDAINDLRTTNEKYAAPTLDIANATVIEAAEHVQKCTAYYGMISKCAGLAASTYALAEGRYKQRFREALGKSDGKNEAAREAYAAEATKAEYKDLLFFESAVKLFSALERSARTAADSSRKIAELVQSHHIAEVGNKY